MASPAGCESCFWCNTSTSKQEPGCSRPSLDGQAAVQGGPVRVAAQLHGSRQAAQAAAKPLSAPLYPSAWQTARGGQRGRPWVPLRPRCVQALMWLLSARARGRGGRFPSAAVAALTARRRLPDPPGRAYSMCSARPEPAMVLAPQRCSFSEMSFCKANRSRQLQPPAPRAPPAVLPGGRARCSLAGPGLASPETGRPGLERAKGARKAPGHGQNGAAGEA